MQHFFARGETLRVRLRGGGLTGRRAVARWRWRLRALSAAGLFACTCAASGLAAASEAAPAESPGEFAAGGVAARGFGARLSQAALARTRHEVRYDPAYYRLAYPNGDPPAGRGVCSDVVVRSLRALGVDLQALVHEDMTAAFEAYPAFWGLSRPDPNIDHRRVPNLERFFARAGARLAPSTDPRDYAPGDVVAWNLKAEAGFLPHIGVVTDRRGPSGWPMVVHNIGAGPELEDVLFQWPMTGRYRPSTVFAADGFAAGRDAGGHRTE